MTTRIAFLAATLLLALPAAAQPTPFGIHEAIEMATRHSPVMGEGRAQLSRSRAQWWTGLGLSRPELHYAREGMPGGFESGFAEQRWGLTQRVDFPLTTYYRLQRFGTQREAVQFGLQARRVQLKSDVKKAYTDLLYAQELLHLRREEVGLNRQLVEAAAVRVEVGEASELEQMKAEIGLAEAESGLAEAQQRFQNTRYELFRVVGLDPEEQRYEIAFPDTLVYIDAEVQQAAVMTALPGQPSLQSAARHLESARYGVRQARSAYLPDLTFELFAHDYGGGFDMSGFQIGFSLPLWLPVESRGRVQTAQANSAEQAWRKEAVALDLKQQAEQAWHGYETSKQTIDRYRSEVQGRADELLERTLEGYQLGEIDLLTLLDTQRTYLAAEQRYYSALRTYYHHLIDLERFLGEELVFTSADTPAQASLTK